MAVFTTVDDAGSFFNPVLYTGTGAILGVTGTGFQPDAVWIKQRNGTGNNVFFDSVRGATEYFLVNTSAANNTSTTDNLTAFDSDGFTLGADSSGEVNASAGPIYVSYNWKAGTTTGIAGSPSITPSSYSFNATSGFSIIEYTGNGTSGATIPHGLGVAPKFILVKNVAFSSWGVQQAASFMGPTRFMYFDEAQAEQSATDKWNDTAPTSTLVSLGDSSIVNTNTQAYMAYCFAEIQGYSKMGEYVSNGNADGPFIYTGFRPAFVIAKITDASDSWAMLDNKRAGYNNANYRLRVNQNTAESQASPSYIDILSNGFKIRLVDQEINSTSAGAEYIYMAWAEAPLVNSSGVPVNAR